MATILGIVSCIFSHNIWESIQIHPILFLLWLGWFIEENACNRQMYNLLETMKRELQVRK